MVLLKGRLLVLLVVVVAGGILFALCSKVQFIMKPHALASSGTLLLAFDSTFRQASTSFSNANLPLGVDGDASTPYPDIHWQRLSYPTCGWGNLAGQVLKDTVQNYHNQGIRILLVVCQWADDSSLLNSNTLNDAARGGADAVQCGNEQMKYHPPATMYVHPNLYAAFFDLCKRAVHAVHASTPALMGSLDPHVAGPDNGLIAQQVKYLDSVQTTMNTVVYKGGHWRWRSESIGLIDTWHNSYPNPNENNLYQLYIFWAGQFNVNLYRGELGGHLWVSEGTGCYIGCGLDPNNHAQEATSHVMTLISDVNTSLTYKVPFFYFSGKDFKLDNTVWPLGVLDLGSHPKPLREDLSMGSRSLRMSCPSRHQRVYDQEQLLATLYNGCTLPSNYAAILES